MPVLVSDSSILIDLARWSLLEAIFDLPFELAVPDTLFEEEILDLGKIHRERLIALGLRIESLDAEGVTRAINYQISRPKLTINDCFAVSLAAINNWPLLTGDKQMRALAEEECVEVHGLFWVIDRFIEHRIVHVTTLAAVLRGMLGDPRTYLPHAEINKRLAILTR